MEPCCPLEGRIPEAQAGGDAGPEPGAPPGPPVKPLSASASHSRTTFRLTSVLLPRQHDVGGAPSSASRSRAPEDSARSAQNTGQHPPGHLPGLSEGFKAPNPKENGVSIPASNLIQTSPILKRLDKERGGGSQGLPRW